MIIDIIKYILLTEKSQAQPCFRKNNITKSPRAYEIIMPYKGGSFARR